MNGILDVETIYRTERKRWLKEEAPRKSIRDRITESVPYWIIVVAFVLYGLSAPHTASVFDKLSPGWGWIAPIGVEFGLLYASFRRRLSKAEHTALHWTLYALEILLFVTAMLVNGAGSFTSVVSVTRLQDLSFAAIIEGFGTLPATSQAALLMALLSAFIIPIGALVAGDGLAALTLEQQLREDVREQRWQEVEFTLVYRAVFVRYMQSGLVEREARQRAYAEVKGYLGKGNQAPVRLLSAGSEQSGQQNGQRTNGQDVSVKGRVQSYLDQHPDLYELSVNQVLTTLQEAGVQVGRTTVAEVIQRHRREG
jgi:hypothetical protein